MRQKKNSLIQNLLVLRFDTRSKMENLAFARASIQMN